MCKCDRKWRRSAFTFIEVMFAVILLGIGFIMVAAMFPVAISQTRANVEETAGSIIAPGAVGALNRSLTDRLAPPTGPVNAIGAVWSFRDSRMAAAYTQARADALWNAVRGNTIQTRDDRYGWVPMFKRNDGDSYAQVIIIGVQNRNRERYVAPVDVTRPPNDGPNDAPATLEPRLFDYTLTPGASASDPDTITFSNGPLDALGAGAYVVISTDTSTTNPGRANGYIYRLGNSGSGTGTWELAPGNDTKNVSYPGGATLQGKAFVVGRGRDAPGNAGSYYAGTAQDVCVYTTFIQLK